MTTTTTKREVNGAAARELLELIATKKAIQNDIYDAMQAYTWTWDDEEAKEIKAEWNKLEGKLHEAEQAIHEFCESFK